MVEASTYVGFKALAISADSDMAMSATVAAPPLIFYTENTLIELLALQLHRLSAHHTPVQRVLHPLPYALLHRHNRLIA